jgi:asparagine synthase (glutamine-hydrolysing)
MCGILSVLHYHPSLCQSIEDIEENFRKHNERGPEETKFEYEEEYNLVTGFHRLAINGCYKSTSMQPLIINGIQLICNGEIYNWKELSKMCGVDCNTGSDCEIIIHLYIKYGINATLKMLDGVFAFVLVDFVDESVYIARDPYGIRPLFVWNLETNFALPLVVASELKMANNIVKYDPKPFPPGHYIRSSLKYKAKNIPSNLRESSVLKYMVVPYHSISTPIDNTIKTVEQAYSRVRDALIAAVEKRITKENRERQAVCLLSGGLDSSLIASLVSKYLRENDMPKLHTWSIGLKGSEDLKCAKIVADHIGSVHHEVVMTEKEFLDSIPNVIEAIESKDTTTVRASVGNWLICREIKKRSDAKVVFNGDGSDEVAGGYLYFHYAPTPLDFDTECKRLLKDIHLFDVLRSDRSISNHGLEARTPFLDLNFVRTYLSIPPSIRDHNNNKQCEKYIIRNAFKDMNLLPDSILFRTKEAFSDGVSNNTKSWFEIIQEFASKKLSMSNKPRAEKMYYRELFNDFYGKNKSQSMKFVMPYKWMPKFVDATDASARTLSVYNTVQQPSTTEQPLSQ